MATGSAQATAMDPGSSIYNVGDIVDVKGHGRATIIGALDADAASPHHGRYHIRYHEDDTTFHVGPSRLRLMHPVSRGCDPVHWTFGFAPAAAAAPSCLGA